MGKSQNGALLLSLLCQHLGAWWVWVEQEQLTSTVAFPPLSQPHFLFPFLNIHRFQYSPRCAGDPGHPGMITVTVTRPNRGGQGGHPAGEWLQGGPDLLRRKHCLLRLILSWPAWERARSLVPGLRDCRATGIACLALSVIQEVHTKKP